ncbi:MAG: VOC family protein [Sphingomonadales bacterium]|nr:VOC family protein [Sphingomonadales bacterium]
MAEFAFHHGGVSVPSLAQAIDWYGRVLGFVLEREFVIPPARAKAAMIRKGPLRFELFEPEDGAPLPEGRSHPPSDIRTHGNKHVAFCIADLDAFIAEMGQKGVDVPFVVREAFGKGCFIRDCAGNLIEFVEEPSP